MKEEKEINRYIEHTALGATLTMHEVATLCEQARIYNFYAVCIPGCFVKNVKQFLEKSNVKIVTVIGFPLGNSSTFSKVFEIKEAIRDGADEFDIVVNISWIKSNHLELVENELFELRKFAENKIIKLILETCLLSNEEIFKITQLAAKVGFDFVKTSTGFSKGGASFEAVKIMKDAIQSIKGSKTQIKASGGIRNYFTAQAFIKAGATRIGTSSSVRIILEAKQSIIENK